MVSPRERIATRPRRETPGASDCDVKRPLEARYPLGSRVEDPAPQGRRRAGAGACRSRGWIQGWCGSEWSTIEMLSSRLRRRSSRPIPRTPSTSPPIRRTEDALMWASGEV